MNDFHTRSTLNFIMFFALSIVIVYSDYLQTKGQRAMMLKLDEVTLMRIQMQEQLDQIHFLKKKEHTH